MAAPQFEFHSDVADLRSVGLYPSVGKRVFDLVMVAFMLPVIVPLLGAILVVVSISGGRPLYSQIRVGRGGRAFRLWKIRTMIPDADLALPRMLNGDPALRAEWLRTQKLSCDPRVTPLGVMLRRLSLDELPQIWNVINGTMSLVGPRPFMLDQLCLYCSGRRDADYYQLRPGITGLWQVSRRNEGSFAERSGYDSAYCAEVSLTTDLSILFATPGVIVRATGK